MGGETHLECTAEMIFLLSHSLCDLKGGQRYEDRQEMKTSSRIAEVHATAQAKERHIATPGGALTTAISCVPWTHLGFLI